MKGFHRSAGVVTLKTLAVGTLLFSTSALAIAQSDSPPERVGRVAYINGPVSYRPTAQDPWTEAAVNIPMTAGTSIWTQPGSRAEIQVGNAIVRLDGGTEVDVLALDYQTIQLSLPEGRVDVHLYGRRQGENYSLATPRATVGLVADGDYRDFAGDQDNPSRAAAFDGESQIATPSDTVNIDPGNEAVVSGDPPVIEMSTARKDDFDAWADDRQARLRVRYTSRYVSPEVIGYQDLDSSGEWRQVPDYGTVWFPTNVQSDWEPYRYGHWRSVAPWGWTWVDDQPWGFAPFHYGRWAHIGDYWGWCPGNVEERPVYAPAEVAWVGDPGSIVVGAAIGAAVGWIALGPGEPYHPWYNASPEYNRQVNIAYVNRTTINNINNVTIINNHNTYVNQRFTTVVPQQAFANARPINAAALRVAPNARIQVAASPRQILPQATPAARFGTATPQAAAPRPAAFAAARMMQTTNRPAVPVAGAFTRTAMVRAAPAAAANFHPAPAGFQGVRKGPAAPAAAIRPAAAVVPPNPASAAAAAKPAIGPAAFHGGSLPKPGNARPEIAPHPTPMAAPAKVPTPVAVPHPSPGAAPAAAKIQAPAPIPHPSAPAAVIAHPAAPPIDRPAPAAVPHVMAVPHPAPAPVPHPVAVPHVAAPSPPRPAPQPPRPAPQPPRPAPQAPRPAPPAPHPQGGHPPNDKDHHQ